MSNNIANCQYTPPHAQHKMTYSFVFVGHHMFNIGVINTDYYYIIIQVYEIIQCVYLDYFDMFSKWILYLNVNGQSCLLGILYNIDICL